MKAKRGKTGSPRQKVKARTKARGSAKGLMAFIGMFASGTGDLGSRHDDYLYGWKKPAR